MLECMSNQEKQDRHILDDAVLLRNDVEASPPFSTYVIVPLFAVTKEPMHQLKQQFAGQQTDSKNLGKTGSREMNAKEVETTWRGLEEKGAER